MEKIFSFHKNRIRFLVLYLFFISCHSKEKKLAPLNNEVMKEVKPEIVPGLIGSHTTKNGFSYTFYIPASFSGKEKYPAMIFLDPHGKGNYPVEKYKSLAEHFQFVLIGSNDSKNGMGFEQSTQIAGDLLNDAFNFLPCSQQQISLSGFSGGAKAALVAGNSVSGFNSIIYCGAAFPPGSFQSKVPSCAFAGKKDMNYTEVLNYNYSIGEHGINHTLVEWNGKHEWPDSATFRHAFYWNIFNSMRNKIIPIDNLLINDFRKYLESLTGKEKNILTKSYYLQEEKDMLQDIVLVDNYKSKMAAIVNSAVYKDARSKQEMILAMEDSKKRELAEAFENKEMPWWDYEIKMLNADPKNESDQRLLGYISLAAWSYSTKSISANNVTFAQKALTIYKMADPENQEQPFLKACLYAKNNLPDSAVYFLAEAIKLGFNDRDRIENEKDLYELHGKNDYQELVNTLKIEN